ncbi:MAG: hypothetical protein KF768_05770 [Phycisphaeraceae bacterium]|nr:hypothetical protein [Phycisphaeraceae bacterium]
MNRPAGMPSRWLLAVAACACVMHTMANASLADDAAARRLMREASALAASGSPERAAPLFKAAAREATDTALRRSAELNAALCAANSLDQKERARAVASIESIERSSRDPRLLGPARTALGRIEHGMGVAVMKESPEQAIEHLTRAERWFRSALIAAGPDPEMERNIELTQRLIEALLRQQEQEQSEHQNQGNESGESQDAPDSQQQDGQAGEGDSQRGDNSEQQQQPNGSQPQAGGEEPQSPDSSGQGGQQSDPAGDNQGKSESGQPSREREGAGEDASKSTDAEREEAQPPPAQGETSEVRGFNPIAAQILDKERRERAALERLKRQMQGRTVRVERDW